MALSIWGKSATGGRYAAIAALTNIPATLLATLFYELILVDSSRGNPPFYLSVSALNSMLTPYSSLVLPRAQQDFLNAHRAHDTHKSLDSTQSQATQSHSSNEKDEFREVGRVA